MAFSNNPHKLPSPEDIDIELPYTFTFNPCDGRQYYYDADRVETFMEYWRTLFDSMFDDIEIDVHLEVSKLGRLHFHGIIKFKNLLNFYLKDIIKLKNEGTLEIDTIEDGEVWEEYCTKQKLLNIHYKNKLTEHREDILRQLRSGFKPRPKKRR